MESKDPNPLKTYVIQQDHKISNSSCFHCKKPSMDVLITNENKQTKTISVHWLCALCFNKSKGCPVITCPTCKSTFNKLPYAASFGSSFRCPWCYEVEYCSAVCAHNQNSLNKHIEQCHVKVSNAQDTDKFMTDSMAAAWISYVRYCFECKAAIENPKLKPLYPLLDHRSVICDNCRSIKIAKYYN